MRLGIPYCLNNLNNGSINMTFEGTLDAWLDAVIYRKLRSRRKMNQRRQISMLARLVSCLRAITHL
jgi:hypothetical protein